MKIIFFGLGSIGRRHARILQSNYRHALYAFRSGHGVNGNDLNIPEVFSWEDVDTIRPEVAFITNPTALHVDTAIECARRGMHIFMEKPLGSDTAGLKTLCSWISRKQVASYVAYVLRFHPVINYLRKLCQKDRVLHMRVLCQSYLPSWHPKRDCRQRYSSQAQMGGGVLFDLSHEFDYTQYVLGRISRMTGQFSRRSQVTVDAEDYADVLVQTAGGPANIHMNFMSQWKQRRVEIDFEHKFVVGDLIGNTVVEYRKGKESKRISFPGDLSTCFEKQIRYFLGNLRNPGMMNNIPESRDLFGKIMAFKQQGA